MKSKSIIALFAFALIATVAGPVSGAQAFKAFRAANGAEKFEVKGTGTEQNFGFVGEGAGGKVKCAKAGYEGHTDYVGPQEFVQFIPGFEGCSAAGRKVKIKITNCEIVFHANGTLQLRTWPENAKPPCTIVIEIEEGVGKTCNATLGEQEGLKAVAYENMKETGSLLMKTSVTNLAYEATGTGCTPLGISLGKHTGTFEGTIKAENLLIE